MIEHGTGKDLPVVLRAGDRYNKPLSHRVTVLYHNTFTRGAGRPGSPAVVTSFPKQILSEDNRFPGFRQSTTPRRR